MEFSIWCPQDGSVEVGLEDVDTILVRGGSDVEVVFLCPVCGERITLAAQVPHALLSSLDEAWVSLDDSDPTLVSLRRAVESGASDPSGHGIERAEQAMAVESYCEYFRRELAGASCVEDMLAEMDAREVR